MKWPILFGKARQQPTTGRWHHWKQLIADHCEGRCVYCAIAEARFGGIRNFHIEHYRPKVRFPHLENDIRNLYLACAVCNVLKCDDWPAEPDPDHSLPAYPDPAVVDYNSLFQVAETHEISSSTVAGRYVIERMALNRAQLILERRLHAIESAISSFNDWVSERLDALTPEEQRQTIEILNDITRAQTATTTARPYKDDDTKRSARVRTTKKRRSR
jgi:hypothetical protein